MRFSVQPNREWVSNVRDGAIQYRSQQRGIKSGWALKNHMDDAHDGKLDPNCRACNEIKKKMESL